MSPEERAIVDGARKRASKAQPGPWWAVLLPATAADEFDQDAVIMSEHVAITDRQTFGEMKPDDARFTAHARSDVPALCDLADRQEAELAAKNTRIAELEAELAGFRSGDQVGVCAGCHGKGYIERGGLYDYEQTQCGLCAARCER